MRQARSGAPRATSWRSPGWSCVGLVSTWIIVQNQRLRIPVLEETPFELKAELETAQAVTPGQGQTVRVAGVRVGDIAEVELRRRQRRGDDGHRPQVPARLPGRHDPAAAQDRASRTCSWSSTRVPRPPASSRTGERSRSRNTAPDVNLDEVLDALDSDTQAYLRLLLAGAGEGLEGNGENLGEVLGSLGPDQQGPRQAQRRGREAQGEPGPADPQHEHPLRPRRPGGRRDRRLHRLLELAL